MNSTYQLLLSLGGIFLAGQIISTLGAKTFFPRVTLLLIFGLLIGKEALDVIPEMFYEWFDLIAQITLLMVGFLIGGKLTLPALKNGTNRILWISTSAAIFSTALVCVALYVAGLPIELAIILGCISSATAPAATLDVVVESNDKGLFSELLISIVALDDAWALMLFGVGMAVASSLSGHLTDSSPILHAVRDIGGAFILGLLLGFPAAYLTGRLKSGEPILTEALGLVFICGGLAIWLDVSFLIASIVMGAVVANFAKHHEYPFHAIENIEWPFMVIFFVLAGAAIELNALVEIGLIGGAYIAARTLGKIIGARIGGQLSGADNNTKNWMGVALLPQAGVSIGMALVAATTFPEHRQLLLSVILGSTVFFELIGPVCTRIALHKTADN